MALRLLIFCIAFLSWGVCFSAPKTKKVHTEYLYHLPANISQDEAREIAVQRAQAQAIADEFGTVVTQSSSIRIETINTESNTDYLSIGGSELKGEWIETVGEPEFEVITDGSDVALLVKITGVIREIESAKVPYEIKMLRNGILDACESDVFKSGDDLYMSFKTPSTGYLAVYLVDTENRAYCLLPYQGQESGFFPVKANRRYVFFNKECAENVERSVVDEIILETAQSKERNRILTVFSPNKFFKANDDLTQSDVPRNLSYSDFQKWLTNLKKKDVDASIMETSILIANE